VAYLGNVILVILKRNEPQAMKRHKNPKFILLRKKPLRKGKTTDAIKNVNDYQECRKNGMNRQSIENF
jgi:hypothetical protein